MPFSAVVSMASPHVHSARASVQPYNPQEWVSPPPASSPPPPPPPPPQRQSQASAAAPPPYAPPRTRRQRPQSTAFDFCARSTSPPPPIPTGAVSMRPRPCPDAPLVNALPPPPDVIRESPREPRSGLPLLPKQRHLDGALLHLTPSLDPNQSAQSSSVAGLIAPPAARRAASTGVLDHPSLPRCRSSSRSAWNHAMPLPPPPPGPSPPGPSPPFGTRSHSVQSLHRSSLPLALPPTRRPPPNGGSSLGPVPPTPTDWVDEDLELPLSGRTRIPNLAVDFDSQIAANAAPASQLPSSSPSANGLLNRAAAVRHDKTIVQRRAESWHKQSTSPHSSLVAVPRPKRGPDMVVTTYPVSCTTASTTSNPRSSDGGKSKAQVDTFRAGESLISSLGQQESSHSIPRAPGFVGLRRLDADTPPFSPQPAEIGQPSNETAPVAPRALPTPPPQTRSASSSRMRDSSRASLDKSSTFQRLLLTQSPERFADAAVERARAFADREATASSDAERARLFADFIVAESRIRRERYSTAIGAMGSEIFDLTRDLFRPMQTPAPDHGHGTSRSPWTPASATGRRTASPGASLVSKLGFPAGASSSTDPALANLPTSPSDDWGLNGASRATNYMPSLSPILSLSVSEKHEGASSRGRPSSRWWESGSQADQCGGTGRSKRECKYMGVSKSQWVQGEGESTVTGGPGTGGEGQSLSDCPSEKAGRNACREASWTPKPLRRGATKSSSAASPARSSTPEPLLDVSRLVTLPPPYPRHHPAVNNNHPELASIRRSVRLLSELSEIGQAKERFAMASAERREGFLQSASERQQSLRANLQKEVELGNLGYADAAAIEADSQEHERSKEKEHEKAEYERFQNEVVLPLNELVTERFSRTTELLDHLSRRLFDNGPLDADMPQEEGDDRPELLEKLTLLKWIFEARESLHKAIFDIISDRNLRYRKVVVTPYKLSGNAEKLRQAEAFFAEDTAKRAHAHAQEVLLRAEGLQRVVEEAVDRGVALQLSAFWDIAPPLRQLLDGIPDDLQGFGVQMPASELDENPSYHEHPLQYLYSLLQHAEKSTYQFIESHTNLLCLVHEVKEVVVKARGQVLAAQAEAADGKALEGEGSGARQASAMRDSESRRLTDELKDKVRAVQEQWNSALGDGMKGVKERIGAWLLQTGGWDEALEDLASFGPF